MDEKEKIEFLLNRRKLYIEYGEDRATAEKLAKEELKERLSIECESN